MGLMRPPGLEAFQARAADDPGWFWGVAADDLGLAWQRRPTATVDLARGPAHARWWVGGAFNHAVAATESWARSRPAAEALAWEGEDGDVRRLTWAELDGTVRAAARRLASAGVGEGTRVGILLPMLVETAIAVLALGRLRAVFSPIFSGYAAPAVAARLNAFEATHLITADGFLRRGTRRAEGGRRRGRDGGADGPDRSGGPAAGRRSTPVPMTAGRDLEWTPRVAGEPRPRRPSRPSDPWRTTRSRRPTPRPRTWSSTPRGRRAARRGPSTSTAASRSRPPRTSPTRSTCGRATPCAGSPTSAG